MTAAIVHGLERVAGFLAFRRIVAEQAAASEEE